MGELFPRADVHEFLDLNFDRRSCKAIAYSTSTVKTLSFSKCTFADNGEAIGEAIQTGTKLTTLELDHCPITHDAFLSIDSGKLLSLQIFTVECKYLVNDTSVLQLCGLPGPSCLHVICRVESLRLVERAQWDAFFESKIKQHPILKTLVFTLIDEHYASPSSVLVASVLDMVESCPNPVLDRIRFLDIFCDEISHQINAQKGFKAIEETLRDKQQCMTLRESPYRQYLLPQAIHAGSNASRYNFVFQLLRENMDLLH